MTAATIASRFALTAGCCWHIVRSPTGSHYRLLRAPGRRSAMPRVEQRGLFSLRPLGGRLSADEPTASIALLSYIFTALPQQNHTCQDRWASRWAAPAL